LALSDSQPPRKRQNPASQTQHLIRQANPASKAKHPASNKQSKPSTQARQAKNNKQSFALVSDTKKQKNPALGRVSFSGFA
jgi:hypothetical protein